MEAKEAPKGAPTLNRHDKAGFLHFVVDRGKRLITDKEPLGNAVKARMRGLSKKAETGMEVGIAGATLLSSGTPLLPNNQHIDTTPAIHRPVNEGKPDDRYQRLQFGFDQATNAITDQQEPEPTTPGDQVTVQPDVQEEGQTEQSSGPNYKKGTRTTGTTVFLVQPSANETERKANEDAEKVADFFLGTLREGINTKLTGTLQDYFLNAIGRFDTNNKAVTRGTRDFGYVIAEKPDKAGGIKGFSPLSVTTGTRPNINPDGVFFATRFYTKYVVAQEGNDITLTLNPINDPNISTLPYIGFAVYHEIDVQLEQLRAQYPEMNPDEFNRTIVTPEVMDGIRRNAWINVAISIGSELMAIEGLSTPACMLSYINVSRQIVTNDSLSDEQRNAQLSNVYDALMQVVVPNQELVYNPDGDGTVAISPVPGGRGGPTSTETRPTEQQQNSMYATVEGTFKDTTVKLIFPEYKDRYTNEEQKAKAEAERQKTVNDFAEWVHNARLLGMEDIVDSLLTDNANILKQLPEAGETNNPERPSYARRLHPRDVSSDENPNPSEYTIPFHEIFISLPENTLAFYLKMFYTGENNYYRPNSAVGIFELAFRARVANEWRKIAQSRVGTNPGSGKEGYYGKQLYDYFESPRGKLDVYTTAFKDIIERYGKAKSLLSSLGIQESYLWSANHTNWTQQNATIDRGRFSTTEERNRVREEAARSFVASTYPEIKATREDIKPLP